MEREVSKLSESINATVVLWHGCYGTTGTLDDFVENCLGRPLTKEERKHIFGPCEGNCGECPAIVNNKRIKRIKGREK